MRQKKLSVLEVSGVDMKTDMEGLMLTIDGRIIDVLLTSGGYFTTIFAIWNIFRVGDGLNHRFSSRPK